MLTAEMHQRIARPCLLGSIPSRTRQTPEPYTVLGSGTTYVRRRAMNAIDDDLH